MFTTIKNFVLVTVFCLSVLVLSGDAYGFKGLIFNTSQALSEGMVVSLDPDDKEKVIASNISNSDTIVGVVSGIAVSDGVTEVEVATEGTIDVLVTTLYGDIKKGDVLGLSTISGIAAKFGGQGVNIGTATEDLNTSGASVTEQQISSEDGADAKTHKVGYVPVKIGIQKVASGEAAKQENYIPSAVQQFSNGLAGKSVTGGRIIAAAAVVVTGFAASMIIIRNAINSSIIAIGRNPLTKKTTLNTLMGIFTLAITILFSSLAVGFLILRI
jgi:hypothetical protein